MGGENGKVYAPKPLVLHKSHDLRGNVLFGRQGTVRARFVGGSG